MGGNDERQLFLFAGLFSAGLRVIGLGAARKEKGVVVSRLDSP